MFVARGRSVSRAAAVAAAAAAAMVMEITEVHHPKTRHQWRRWLQKHHASKTEVWLRTYKVATGKPRVSYDDVVEECLCFGWIDGTVKSYDDESTVQRMTPRRPKRSNLSELNRQRLWKLQRVPGMINVGALAAIADQIGDANSTELDVPEWILVQLQADKECWKRWNALPLRYRRLRMAYIAVLSASRREDAQKRVVNLIKKTRQGKMFGTIVDGVTNVHGSLPAVPPPLMAVATTAATTTSSNSSRSTQPSKKKRRRKQ